MQFLLEQNIIQNAFSVCVCIVWAGSAVSIGSWEFTVSKSHTAYWMKVLL